MSTAECYAQAEARYGRWLQEYRQQRASHCEARRAHPNPVAIDAEFARQYRLVVGPDRGSDSGRSDSIRRATDLLLEGACASLEHFQDYELSGRNLGDIVDLLESRKPHSALVRFLVALTASGSTAVLSNRRYCGNGGQEVPYFVLRAAVTGDPWGYSRPDMSHAGSREDRALRGASLRILARMAFWSAERECARGGTHAFMKLLETNRGGLHPFEEFETRHLLPPLNQARMLQVLYLMIYVYRSFPWPHRRQYLADVEHANALHARYSWEGGSMRESLARRMVRIAILVPGALQALLVDNDLWHVFVAYGFNKHDTHGCIHSYRSSNNNRGSRGGSGCVWNDHLGSRQGENRLVGVLRDQPFVSAWICGKSGGRCLLMELCRQRRRRVVQAVAKGAPSAFAPAVQDLLEFVRGPRTRGKKERLTAWLESQLQN